MRCISYYSYIKPQLTLGWIVPLSSCISYYSYIKPQPRSKAICRFFVVYRTIPTSNHNLVGIWKTTLLLYIVLFLHQTTTYGYGYFFKRCCISYYSYIKPQLSYAQAFKAIVVYRTIPTSNHNWICRLTLTVVLYIVLFLHQTTTSSYVSYW